MPCKKTKLHHFHFFFQPFAGLRNENGLARLYLSPGPDAYKLVKGLYNGSVDYEREVPILVDCMRGIVIPTKENVTHDGVLPSPIPGLHPVCENKVLTVKFLDPQYADDFVYPARKLEGARDQPKVLGANEGPVIGFGQRTNRGGLGSAGHRMMNHYVGNNRGGGGGGGRGGGGGGGRNDYSNFSRGEYLNRILFTIPYYFMAERLYLPCLLLEELFRKGNPSELR